VRKDGGKSHEVSEIRGVEVARMAPKSWGNLEIQTSESGPCYVAKV
jgi:hypothetical protein